MSVDVQQVARARYLTGCTCKSDFQTLPLSDSATLEQDGQALLVLGHQRRLPAAATSLVEKVRKRVLILTSMLRELDHDSLIFFHADRRRRYVRNPMLFLRPEQSYFARRVAAE